MYSGPNSSIMLSILLQKEVKKYCTVYFSGDYDILKCAYLTIIELAILIIAFLFELLISLYLEPNDLVLSYLMRYVLSSSKNFSSLVNVHQLLFLPMQKLLLPAKHQGMLVLVNLLNDVLSAQQKGNRNKHYCIFLRKSENFCLCQIIGTAKYSYYSTSFLQ